MKSELQDMINDCTAELADINHRISRMPPLDKGKTYYTQYALIKACGTLEYVYRSIVADYFSQFGIPQIETYLEKDIRNGSMSATYDNMKKLLKRFDESWSDLFTAKVQAHENGQRLISSAKSIVNNRHQFAHGKTPTATFSDIQQYYSDALILVGIVDETINIE